MKCVISSCLAAAYKQNEGGASASHGKKDAAPALLNKDRKNGEYENVALQAQRDVFQDQVHDLIINCLVPRAKDLGKDNIVMINEKNIPPR